MRTQVLTILFQKQFRDKMSFIKRWDVGDIQRQISACASQVNSTYNDGFTAWHCKQDLLIVKYQLEEILRTAPTFAPEKEFIREWITNTEKTVYDAIREQNEKNKADWAAPLNAVTCTECGHVDRVGIDLDQASFFATA